MAVVVMLSERLRGRSTGIEIRRAAPLIEEPSKPWGCETTQRVAPRSPTGTVTSRLPLGTSCDSQRSRNPGSCIARDPEVCLALAQVAVVAGGQVVGEVERAAAPPGLDGDAYAAA